MASTNAAELARAAPLTTRRTAARPLARRWHAYWLFVVPALVCVVLFVVLPLAYAVWLSLRNYNLQFGTNRFIGLANYTRALADTDFHFAFGRTLLYVVVVVTADFVIGFSQALLLYRLSSGWSRALRGVFMLPILLIPSAAAMLWRMVMYNPPFQEFNRVLGLPESFSILAQPNTAFWGIVLTVIWAWSPWVFLLLLGGLESLDTAPLEAAALDGASFWRTVWDIILPMMRPVIFVTLGFKAIDSFLTFPFPWVMTEGGPAGSSHVLSTYIYENAFKFLNYGYGSALALLMLLAGAAVSTVGIVFAWRKGYV
jgi:ABC-type sugar transport system permease subunit